MTEIDFGTLVTAVVNELNCTTSELFGDELTDPDLAVKRYNRNVIGAIRRVFDEAEAPAPVTPTVPPCVRCGEEVDVDAKFCGSCGLPLAADAVPRWLIDVLAKDAGAAADDPRVMQALLTFRQEDPEGWNRLMQKIESRSEAAVNDAVTPAA